MSDETAPKVFGVTMARIVGDSYLLTLDGATFQIENLRNGWHAFASVAGLAWLETDGALSKYEAALDIETKIRKLAKTLVPLLDDNAKRDVIRALRSAEKGTNDDG